MKAPHERVERLGTVDVDPYCWQLGAVADGAWLPQPRGHTEIDRPARPIVPADEHLYVVDVACLDGLRGTSTAHVRNGTQLDRVLGITMQPRDDQGRMTVSFLAALVQAV